MNLGARCSVALSMTRVMNAIDATLRHGVGHSIVHVSNVILPRSNALLQLLLKANAKRGAAQRGLTPPKEAYRAVFRLD